MDETEERRSKRAKRDSSYKAKAFEKFKLLKSGKRNKYEEEEVDNVYDIVDEKEYVNKVLARQDDDWIVDDDGSGYVEDGRDVFDDDLDVESIAAASSSKGKGVKRKKKAVSENAGKGNLQYLLSNMPAKKKEEEKLGNDDVLSELLGEIDETPARSKPKTVSASRSLISAKKAEKDYMKSFSAPVKKPPTITKLPPKQPEPTPKILKEIQINLPAKTTREEHEESVAIETPPSPPSQEIGIATQNSAVIEDFSTQDTFGDDDFDISQVEEFEAQLNKTEVETEPKEVEDFEAELMKDWVVAEEFNEEETEAPAFDDKNVFRFFWWDAFEDVGKQPGVVFLFGKTYHEESKAYVSCCVAVRDIERKLYFLPRTFEEGTGKEVTSQDVYTEINDSIMKPRHVKHFKARPIAKKYCFDPEIPAESDYVEVRYSAQDRGVGSTTQGKTFSKVFGTESSYLEIFLLDRKIKGPCWLDISNAVPVTNPFTWCRLEMNCHKVADVNIAQSEKPMPPPPLVVTTINMRRAVNPKTAANEIVMLSCVANMKYAVDKQAPTVPFQKHFCVFTGPQQQVLPPNLHGVLKNYKATTVQKMDTEKALLNYFINQFSKLDSDLIVGHDLQGYQINVLSDRLAHHKITNFSKLGRIKRTVLIKQKLERELFVGRLVCDIKISAKELIKLRSYDMESLCSSVLKVKERIDLEPEDIPKLFQTPQDIIKLVSITMQDTCYILKIMYNLNIIPLALQITNIAGNVLSKTLLGGRSERNEFLLLHAFSEKGYIVPDKVYKKREDFGEKKSVRKKPAYSGGLVLEPKIGFYDKLILLMDFNSLYPSIIQEYNICFTTAPPGLSEDNMVLPDRNLPSGILPIEIRKLVESRREVKKLMNNPDNSNDLRIQYHIRQMALKLTANSMYGCLGFSNSRFYAKNLAALITHKGREILTNTRDLVQKMNFDVIYGDTDSIMINTNIDEFDQVFKIGGKIKQEINKLYRQVELEIDGVFKYLLLLKKKKYAAVTLTKTKSGELHTETEYKGLDIVRRDWSQLSAEAGKFILNEILSDQSPDDRITNIHAHLTKLKEDLEADRVPLSLLVITKQLTKNPNLYADKLQLPHVQVALRYNSNSGGHLRAGDTVPYVICDDGTANSTTQRAYHVEELKSSTTLKVDIKYYLGQQIHPVVSRICQPIEGTDAFQIAECLGLDTTSFKKPRQNSEVVLGENITKPEVKFRNVDKFVFKCLACKTENTVEGALEGNVSFLEKCCNSDCTARPVEYLGYVKNKLIQTINSYVDKYYLYMMYCEDPMCTNETVRLPVHFLGRFPVCTLCKNSIMLKSYTEGNLYSQLTYFQYIFDLGRLSKRPILEEQVEIGFNVLKETVENWLSYSGYLIINQDELYSGFAVAENKNKAEANSAEFVLETEEDEDLD